MSTNFGLVSLSTGTGEKFRLPEASASEGAEPSATQSTGHPGEWPGSVASEGVGNGRTGERQRRALEAVEAQRTAARRAARQHLPSPAEVAREIALALFEVEAGRRSAAQLERVFARSSGT
jgi:hypothetical protein